MKQKSEAVSRLQEKLIRGDFVVTGELGPPAGTDVSIIEEKARHLAGAVDAVNITDNQTAIVRMSSIATGKILFDRGIEPIIQMTARDRNRIAIQSDILGAAALGLKNILFVSGDHQSFGNQVYCRGVNDIDSMQMLAVARRMRDEKKLLHSDIELKGDVPVFIGAAANPFAPPLDFRPLRLKKKSDAGADFIQTQCIYDIEIFKAYMKRVVDLGLHEKLYILAGLMPLKSAPMARYMSEKVPGVVVPDELVKRMAGVEKKRAADQGIEITRELAEQVKEVKGVAGIHLMAVEWEHRVPEIIEKAGLRL